MNSPHLTTDTVIARSFGSRQMAESFIQRYYSEDSPMSYTPKLLEYTVCGQKVTKWVVELGLLGETCFVGLWSWGDPDTVRKAVQDIYEEERRHRCEKIWGKKITPP